MALSPEHRALLLASTKEQAVALLDDFQYLRTLLKNGLAASDLRRSSGTLRRLLVERDIAEVAAPRIGRIMFQMPDNRPVYEASAIAPIGYFASGGVEAFGVFFRGTVLDFNASKRPIVMPSAEAMELGRLDNFLSQNVLCLHGEWATRGDVIKHVAHIASGVHSGTAYDEIDKTLSKIRRSVWYSKTDEGLSTTFDMHSFRRIVEPEFHYSPDAIDPALLELLSTIFYLFKSEDVLRLEETVRQEFA